MKKQLLLLAALGSSLLVAKHPGANGTPTVTIDVPTTVDLAKLVAVYQAKTAATDEDRVIKGFLDNVIVERVQWHLFGSRTVFHLSAISSLALRCKDVPPDIIDMVLKTIEYDEYGVALNAYHPSLEEEAEVLTTMLKESDEWHVNNRSTSTVFMFLTSQKVAIARRSERIKRAQEETAQRLAHKEAAMRELMYLS